jgi:hypothetical protein
MPKQNVTLNNIQQSTIKSQTSYEKAQLKAALKR